MIDDGEATGDARDIGSGSAPQRSSVFWRKEFAGSFVSQLMPSRVLELAGEDNGQPIQAVDNDPHPTMARRNE